MKNIEDYEMMKIIVGIPKEACELTLNVKCIDDNKIMNLSAIYNSEAIREARNDYLELDPDDCAFGIWKLTDEYQEYLNKYGTDADITFEEYLKNCKGENN